MGNNMGNNFHPGPGAGTAGSFAAERSRRDLCWIQEEEMWAASAKSKATGLSAGSPRKPAAVALLTSRLGPNLCLDDARSDEENQFLVCGLHRAMLEQVAQVRDIPEQRYLRDVERVVGLDHAANHHRTAIGHQHLRGGLLGDQFWVA